jgi:hypothetical protein
MIRLVAVVETATSPPSRKPPCYGKQVGEVAPAPRLDVLVHIMSGARESKIMADGPQEVPFRPERQWS